MGQQVLQIGSQAEGGQYDGASKAVDGGEEFCEVFALGGDAHIVFERQNPRCPCPEDGLVVRENDSIHEFRGLPRVKLARKSPYRRIAEVVRECLEFGQFRAVFVRRGDQLVIIRVSES